MAFRIGIVDGEVYVPEALYPEHFHMTGCFVHKVDSSGDATHYEKLIPTLDFEKHSCGCDPYDFKA